MDSVRNFKVSKNLGSSKSSYIYHSIFPVRSPVLSVFSAGETFSSGKTGTLHSAISSTKEK